MGKTVVIYPPPTIVIRLFAVDHCLHTKIMHMFIVSDLKVQSHDVINCLCSIVLESSAQGCRLYRMQESKSPAVVILCPDTSLQSHCPYYRMRWRNFWSICCRSILFLFLLSLSLSFFWCDTKTGSSKEKGRARKNPLFRGGRGGECVLLQKKSVVDPPTL